MNARCLALVCAGALGVAAVAAVAYLAAVELRWIEKTA